MKLSLAECEERVDAGTDWLDGRFPQWQEGIELCTLDVQSIFSCPLAQASGDTYSEPAAGLSNNDAEGLGFRVPHMDALRDVSMAESDANFRRITGVWIQRIHDYLNPIDAAPLYSWEIPANVPVERVPALQR